MPDPTTVLSSGVLALDAGDDPMDLLAALDCYRAACAEGALVRETVAKAAGLWNRRPIETMTWESVLAAAVAADRAASTDPAVRHRPALAGDVGRVVDTMLEARRRYASLSLKHGRVRLVVVRAPRTA